jgi:hypothetical protein
MMGESSRSMLLRPSLLEARRPPLSGVQGLVSERAASLAPMPGMGRRGRGRVGVGSDGVCGQMGVVKWVRGWGWSGGGSGSSDEWLGWG